MVKKKGMAILYIAPSRSFKTCVCKDTSREARMVLVIMLITVEGKRNQRTAAETARGGRREEELKEEPSGMACMRETTIIITTRNM